MVVLSAGDEAVRGERVEEEDVGASLESGSE